MCILAQLYTVSVKARFNSPVQPGSEVFRLIFDIIPPMDIHELTEAMHQFVSTQGWYAHESRRPQTLRNLSISLSLEAAEVLEHFQWGEQDVDHKALAGELADVALYLLQIASISGIDLEQAILQKLEQNYQRKWE